MARKRRIALVLFAAALIVAGAWTVHAALYHHRITVLLRDLRSADGAVAKTAEDALGRMASATAARRLIAEYHAIEDQLSEAWEQVDSSDNLDNFQEAYERFNESARAPGEVQERIMALIRRIGPPAIGPIIADLGYDVPFWRRWQGVPDEGGCSCGDSDLWREAPRILAETGEPALVPVIRALGSHNQKRAWYAAQALDLMPVISTRANRPLLAFLERPNYHSLSVARALGRTS
ncbi:MAG: hypothetical protein ACYTAN_14620, partial [Planctomycetota bacterium]